MTGCEWSGSSQGHAEHVATLILDAVDHLIRAAAEKEAGA